MLDIIAVEWSIHPFLLNLDSYVLELSPCKKQSRIKIHKIANAFYLKSLSQGYIKTWFTMLTRITNSSIGICNERKIRRILQTSRGFWNSKGRKDKVWKAISLSKHLEEKEVSKVSCRILYSLFLWPHLEFAICTDNQEVKYWFSIIGCNGLDGGWPYWTVWWTGSIAKSEWLFVVQIVFQIPNFAFNNCDWWLENDSTHPVSHAENIWDPKISSRLCAFNTVKEMLISFLDIPFCESVSSVSMTLQ